MPIGIYSSAPTASVTPASKTDLVDGQYGTETDNHDILSLN